MLTNEKIAIVEEYIRLGRQIRILGEKIEALEQTLGSALGNGVFLYQDYVLRVKDINHTDEDQDSDRDDGDQEGPEWYIEVDTVTELKNDE